MKAAVFSPSALCSLKRTLQNGRDWNGQEHQESHPPGDRVHRWHWAPHLQALSEAR